jgi:Fur family ferric uptake transcriptional regulator
VKREFQQFQAFLRSRGLKLTRTRVLIFKKIFSPPAVHPNAYEIHDRLARNGHHISLATIYRTLNLLVKSGLVSSIDLGESHSHFEPGPSRTAHGHLICLACGQVLEFSHPDIQETIDRIGQEKGFRLGKFSLQVFGFCEKCRKERL